MRAIASIIAGVCIASLAIAQENEPTANLPIDPSLQAPSQFAVLDVPDDSNDFVALQWIPVPEAARYIIYSEYVDDGEETQEALWLNEAKVSIVPRATVQAIPGVEEMNVIVNAPVGPAAIVWAVSAVIGDAQTPLAWGRLVPELTAVRATSWAAVKADR